MPREPDFKSLSVGISIALRVRPPKLDIKTMDDLRKALDVEFEKAANQNELDFAFNPIMTL